jgi:GNAT superfamily N-acetyltransferase
MPLPPNYEIRDGADADAAHAFLTHSYWAKGRTLDVVRASFEASLQMSVWHGEEQVAMARIISDFTTFAYVNDVYVLEAHRGLGISKALIAAVLAHPKLANIERWALFTKDAQGLYAQFGWRQYPWPERMMIIDPVVFP